MRNVLIALRDREEAARLTAAAARLASTGTEVEVVHVLGRDSVRGFAESDVVHAVDLLRARGLTARGHVESIDESGVAGALGRCATAAGAGIVLMGSRGLSDLGGLVGGSVSHALLATVDLPVMVLPRGARVDPHGFRRVLVAVRSEDDAARSLAAVRLLPGPVEVLIVHVPRKVALHAGERPFLELGETSSVVLQTARRRFEAEGLNASADAPHREGRVAETIGEAAREWDADLVVLSSRRPGNWSALLSGSTSHDVLRHCDRPVLIAGRDPGA